MHFHVLTLFPEMIEEGLSTSVTGRALDRGLIHLNTINIRDFSRDKHRHVDDTPYGGGAGMVMQAEPIWLAYQYLKDQISEEDSVNPASPDGSSQASLLQEKESGGEREEGLTEAGPRSRLRLVYVTPQGKTFHQAMAEEFAQEDHLAFLCGHYEGVDERILEEIVTDYVSIGDYVLTGGELPVMVMIDAISRLIPGVLGNDQSAEYESFYDNLLEHPHYTRPLSFHGKVVPEVLLSGHHANIRLWRRQQSLKRTMQRRPDLLRKAQLSKEDLRYLSSLGWEKDSDTE